MIPQAIGSLELQVGDVVVMNTYTAAVESVDTTANTVRWAGRYRTCRFAPERVGTVHHFTTRRATRLVVLRGAS